MNRSLFIFLILAGAAMLPAQQTAVATSPDLAGIAHIALRVQSLDAAITFYEKLGFMQAFSLSRDGAVYELFLKINDRQFIELYPATARDPQTGFLHLCFEGKDLQAVHDYYVAKGLTPTDVRTAGAGNLLFTMHGPMSPTGAQNMEYTQYMPGSLHSKDVGQHLGASRISTHLIDVDVAVDDPAAAAAFYKDKLSFVETQSAGTMRFELPAATDEAITIVPSQPLGFKARITFAADTAKAALALSALHIPFTRAKRELLLSDPDGDQIILHPEQ